eukprot:CAMPEP_0177647604 /NCGR_PEP_ID=MMETSP0447-20121125/10387_1 /TAXON_ID=0 /ORGANISM="Stygamoeba regulata, Strain BSH-02190019" /LENGTH=978 /DNA_ID=CAMNT_0019150197 /DNA_START=144 /DNA_END=3080 /DNA_ORIENTATION=+
MEGGLTSEEEEQAGKGKCRAARVEEGEASESEHGGNGEEEGEGGDEEDEDEEDDDENDDSEEDSDGEDMGDSDGEEKGGEEGKGDQSKEGSEEGGNTLALKVTNVRVARTEEVESARSKLPIIMEEQPIMEMVRAHDVCIICGETGSGKTTQVPQFLYEAGYGLPGSPTPGLVGVTQPRRVAAVSMAARVAFELNAVDTGLVGHQVRYDRQAGPNTRIKFMTDGILLREIQADFLLTRYSAVVIDEAHERNINTDILIGLLSRIIPLRNRLWAEGVAKGGPVRPGVVSPLKMIVMSATLRVEDFTANKALFPVPPPVLSVESRQYPVAIHFSKRTSLANYVQDTFVKVCRIHRKLPEGGILVFLTGQREIEHLCRLLRREFGCALPGDAAERGERERDTDDDTDSGADSGGEGDAAPRAAPVLVLPLYSAMSAARQLRVFHAPPPGVRKIMVATNVAETSLTISGIKYVVDCGRVKVRRYDKVCGISRFEVAWCSRASANQRAGRAGRTGPGHCYRLFSAAVFANHFEEFAPPEILEAPVDGMVLQMKAMGIKSVTSFPFPTPPDAQGLQSALHLLVHLGALEDNEARSITDLGRTLAQFPLAPRFAKMLALGNQRGVLPHAIAVVAALTVGSPLLRDAAGGEEGAAGEEGADKPPADAESARKRRNSARVAHSKWVGREKREASSDLLVALRAIGAYSAAVNKDMFCEANFLNAKAMHEIADLRTQLAAIAAKVHGVDFAARMPPPTPAQELLLCQLLTSCFMDRIARLRTTAPGGRHCYTAVGKVEGDVFVHPASFLHGDGDAYVAYHEIIETSRKFMRGVTAVRPQWLPVVAPTMCRVSRVHETPAPRYDARRDAIVCVASVTYGSQWELPAQEMLHPPSPELFRHFARALLEGEVVPLPPACCACRAGLPATIVKSWAVPKAAMLARALASNGIASKAALVEKWKVSPQFLLAECKEWFQPHVRPALQAAWPPG